MTHALTGLARTTSRGWDRAAESARTGTVGFVALTVAVGALTGLGAVGFRWLIEHATLVFSGFADYSAVGVGQHPANPNLPWLGPWFVVLAPVVGGLVYGPIVYLGAREARGHGVPEVMLAVARHGGRIRARVAAVKALASAICIGSGGSVGREGPIVQIGAALGSSVGQATRMPLDRMRTLVAAGAAAGIAATFNAPIAGVLFALELILRDFRARSFGFVVLSSVVASVVGRAILGDDPFLALPAFTIDSAWTYLLFALLGLVAGAVGIGFTRILYAVEDLCDRVWRGPEWLRPAAGGVLLGLVLLVLPQMYGVGYPVLETGVNGGYVVGFLLLLLVGKVVATSLTLGIGGSGGVFAPSLFIGGMLGAAFGQVAHALVPALAPSPGAFAIVGMGAVFAGTARAPLTAVIMLFELTGEYTIILPLMLAIVLATGVSRALSDDTVYSLKLRRRGIVLDGHPADQVLTDLRVADVMDPAPPTLAPGAPLPGAARTVFASGSPTLAVVDDGRLRGQLRAADVARSLDEDDDVAHRTVADVYDEVGRVGVDGSLRDAVDVLRRRPDDAGVAVVDAGGSLVGWLSHRAVLGALANATAAHD
ncbi:CIC family chloride channel protein [Sediminihabitans luteus]|uniref:CIC family chloride channel protein n=1 Tax=Sediminihabitans luteus TaxID=1138585 RepID=A0A2M9CQP4_9CELL|nr:chloride channel protein [Sediminihabitans luteus]PJJ74151.1 CIC family chloride channel protein [Sediminihabitans luteus]GII99004.1 transport integral membrane protein [Sediminihabitans luteus]